MAEENASKPGPASQPRAPFEISIHKGPCNRADVTLETDLFIPTEWNMIEFYAVPLLCRYSFWAM